MLSRFDGVKGLVETVGSQFICRRRKIHTEWQQLLYPFEVYASSTCDFRIPCVLDEDVLFFINDNKLQQRNLTSNKKDIFALCTCAKGIGFQYSIITHGSVLLFLFCGKDGILFLHAFDKVAFTWRCSSLGRPASTFTILKALFCSTNKRKFETETMFE